MHRRIGDDLLPLNTELEKTIRILKKENAATEHQAWHNKKMLIRIYQLQLRYLSRDRGQWRTFDHQRIRLNYETATHRGKQLRIEACSDHHGVA